MTGNGLNKRYAGATFPDQATERPVGDRFWGQVRAWCGACGASRRWGWVDQARFAPPEGSPRRQRRAAQSGVNLSSLQATFRNALPSTEFRRRAQSDRLA